MVSLELSQKYRPTFNAWAIGAIRSIKLEARKQSRRCTIAFNKKAAPNYALGYSAEKVITRREKQVLKWIQRGGTSKQIAAELHVLLKTIEYNRNIMTETD